MNNLTRLHLRHLLERLTSARALDVWTQFMTLSLLVQTEISILFTALSGRGRRRDSWHDTNHS